jgi:hypothetical protein
MKAIPGGREGDGILNGWMNKQKTLTSRQASRQRKKWTD